MISMLSQQAIEFLRFFALSQSEKIDYLRSTSEGTRYVTPDGETEILFASEAAMRAAFKVINSEMWEASDGIKPLLSEISCVIGMVLDLAEQIDYVWLLDKAKQPITGPVDDAWLVLKRLSFTALQLAGKEIAPPTTAYPELLKVVGFRLAVG